MWLDGSFLAISRNLTISIDVQDELGSQFHTMQKSHVRPVQAEIARQICRFPAQGSFLACWCRDPSVSARSSSTLWQVDPHIRTRWANGPDASEAQSEPRSNLSSSAAASSLLKRERARRQPGLFGARPPSPCGRAAPAVDCLLRSPKTKSPIRRAMWAQR